MGSPRQLQPAPQLSILGPCTDELGVHNCRCIGTIIVTLCTGGAMGLFLLTHCKGVGGWVKHRHIYKDRVILF